VARGFNAPPLLWKYFEQDLSGITVSPDIKPERALNYEAGFESQPIDKFWIKLSLYRSEVTDAIALDVDNLMMKNFEKFRRQGLELQFRIGLMKNLALYASCAFNDVKNRATGEAVRDGVGPRQRYDLGIEYKNVSGFSISLKSYYNRWDQSQDFFQPNDRKMIADLRVAQKFSLITCFLNVYNLTNSKYWIDYYYPIPRRYFEGGMILEW
jgi:outer membrane receptor protein involved in Fe transport